MGIPVIGFSAWSGTGKTRILEAVIRILTEKGLRIGVIKHDVHGFEIDQPGKDSFRHRQAGAAAVVLTSPARTAVIEETGIDLDQCIARIRDVDLILVEGFKDAPIPRIGISRKATGKGLPCGPEAYIAVVTDDETLRTEGPRFGIDETEALADWIFRQVRGAAPEAPMETSQTGIREKAKDMTEKDMPEKNMPEQEKRETEGDFTHFNDQGRARMVDVGEKAPTARRAVAAGRVLVNRETFDKIRSGGMKKGDVLTVAQIAGIMAAKHTPDWIPMCHPVPISGIDLKLTLNEERLSVEIEASAECFGRTGVEMEALTAVSGAALTVYDMCKAVQKDMVIDDIRLIRKTGGIHGDYERKETENG